MRRVVITGIGMLLQGLRTRQIDLVDVETASASPYAASLLFDYVANYMYEDDTPAAERRAQALSLDRDLLRELLGQEELRDLIDPGALAEVEDSCAATPRTPDELHDLLRRRGDLRDDEYDAELAEPLLARTARGARARGGRAAPDRRRGRGPLPRRARRDAAGRAARGFPRGRRRAAALAPAPLRPLPRPFTTGEANERFGRDVEPVLRELERADQLVRGELRPGGSEREWCDPEVLRRLRRASLAALRREVEPAEQAAFGRFLPSWHGIDRRATLREALVPLQGLALPVALWESRGAAAPRARLPAGAARRALRLGRGRLGRRRARPRRRLLPRGRAGARPAARSATGRSARCTSAARALGRSALFWYDLLADTGLEAEEALPALWDLVWAGEVTNDAWTPLRAGRRYQAQAQRPTRARAASRAAAPARSPRRRAAGR